MIETKKEIREKRLIQRVNYPLDLKYARIMEKNFEKPIIGHFTIINDVKGDKNIQKQTENILQSHSRGGGNPD